MKIIGRDSGSQNDGSVTSASLPNHGITGVQRDQNFVLDS